MPKKYKVRAIANYHCSTGENPIWDTDKHVLYWSDIPNGKIFEYYPATGEHREIYSGEQVGGFTIQEDGTLLLFRVDDIAVRRNDGSVETVIKFTNDGMSRFNDVFADPEGRVYAGTMGDDMRGGLYRVDIDGSVTCLFKGTNCSNGMAFSPDLKTFYWTDTSSKTIFMFDYERTTGELTNRRKFVVVIDDGRNQLPDGMTVDVEGNVYSAQWNGSDIVKYDPSGKVIDVIEMPVGKISSVVFGGESMRDLYITTAGGDPVNDGDCMADGTLYCVNTDTKGRMEFRSRIGL